MHTTTCQVYLHPAAITSTIAVRAIEQVTGHVACVSRSRNFVRLIPRAEHNRLQRLQEGGAA